MTKTHMTTESLDADRSVVLGGKRYPVRVLPFCDLKRATAAFSRAGRALARGDIDEQTMSDLATVVSAGICVAKEIFEQMTMRQDELNDAFVKVAQVAGMVPEDKTATEEQSEEQTGEAVGKSAGGNGTIYMPISLPVPAGPGNTSINT